MLRFWFSPKKTQFFSFRQKRTIVVIFDEKENPSTRIEAGLVTKGKNMDTATPQETAIDFEAIEQRARSGERLSTKKLAQEMNIKASQMRTHLIAHFGKRITFQRGRTGGIRIG